NFRSNRRVIKKNWIKKAADSSKTYEIELSSEMLSWKEGTEIDTEKAVHSQEVLNEIKIGPLSEDLIKNQVKEKERQEDLITIA
ncbi:5787_t:CDS:1, partial [Ambispora leptoticha]